MGASNRANRAAPIFALGVGAFALAGCDVLLGLQHYKDVACAVDCGLDAEADGRGSTIDAAEDSDVAMATDAPSSTDAPGAPEAVATSPDGGFPVPTAHETWAHWPMPNPEASTFPDSSTLLPHTMAYDAGAGGDALVVYDMVTQLRWSQAAPAAGYALAWAACLALPGSGWRVPTRIELVSLIDFTQPAGSATIDPTAFPSVLREAAWTSSVVAGDGGTPVYWAVDFATGLTVNSGSAASQVFCVNGGAS